MNARLLAFGCIAFLIGLLFHQGSHLVLPDGPIVDAAQALLVAGAALAKLPWDGNERRKRR